MKKVFSFAILTCILLMGSVSYAYNYTEQQKNAFYNDFIKGYIMGIDIVANSLKLPQAKKQQIKNYMRASINRQELVNMTWGCLQTKNLNNTNEIIQCAKPWADKQNEKLYNYVQQMNKR